MDDYKEYETYLTYIKTEIPKDQAVLKINENLHMYFQKPWPCWLHRTMQRLLLGWVWEDLRDGQA